MLEDFLSLKTELGQCYDDRYLQSPAQSAEHNTAPALSHEHNAPSKVAYAPDSNRGRQEARAK